MNFQNLARKIADKSRIPIDRESEHWQNIFHSAYNILNGIELPEWARPGKPIPVNDPSGNDYLRGWRDCHDEVVKALEGEVKDIWCKHCLFSDVTKKWYFRNEKENYFEEADVEDWKMCPICGTPHPDHIVDANN